MKVSREKKRLRNFSDIRSGMHPGRFGVGKRIRRYFSDNTINLRPTFYKRHRLLVAGAAVVIAVASVFSVRQIFTRAEVADFYPSICLGTWQNPANAQGHLETFDVPSSSFNGANSAIFAPSSEGAENQIFCGGFLPVNFQSEGTIKDVSLTLVWQITTSTEPLQPPESSSTPVAPPQEENSSSTTSRFQRGSPGAAFFYKIFSRIFQLALADETSSTNDTSTPASSSSEDITTTEQAPPTSTPPTENNQTSTENPSSTFSAASSTEATSTTTSTPAVVPPPPPPDNNFLAIGYSTDGQNWDEIARINPENWQNFKVPLPVTNWDDLKKVQVRIEGIPTTLSQIPPVLLDGMLLEVHYDLPPAVTIPGLENLNQSPQPAQEIKVAKIYDAEAKHNCSVEPFSRKATIGETTLHYTVHLNPSYAGASYNLKTGDLPAGISADFSSTTSSTSSENLKLSLANNHQKGSFSIVILYEEKQKDNSSLLNFCQLNAVVE